jgi:hypothetical protein
LKELIDSFISIVPQNLIKNFTPEELEILICGLPIISLEDWKSNTIYSGGYEEDNNVIKWFWEILGEMMEVYYFIDFFINPFLFILCFCAFYTYIYIEFFLYIFKSN